MCVQWFALRWWRGSGAGGTEVGGASGWSAGRQDRAAEVQRDICYPHCSILTMSLRTRPYSQTPCSLTTTIFKVPIDD
ncbi:hypothetical protein E2C01_080780 [Portunus trituberculatus]|uniref:Uncharacterized protein n=1 Tax=Portunus trituberculatus TaxID=210409 RepID=A0A5B7IQ93_PORTR|nr:hypothetical protein [Portunus trituberculatus]